MDYMIKILMEAAMRAERDCENFNIFLIHSLWPKYRRNRLAGPPKGPLSKLHMALPDFKPWLRHCASTGP